MELTINKTRPQIEAFKALIDDLQPQRIVQVGAGGGAAFLAQIAKPYRMVVCDLFPSAEFDWFLDELDLRPSVTARYGPGAFDIDWELFGGPLDLVVDDEGTAATFDLLFPRLRPGGVYVVNWTPIT